MQFDNKRRRYGALIGELGRESQITRLNMRLYEWVIDTACRKPTDFGYAAEIWTHAKLISLLDPHLSAFE